MTEPAQPITLGTTWSMHAGWDAEQDCWVNPGHPLYVRAFGHEPIPVTLTATADGPYWGWIDTRSTHAFADREEEPTMVYLHRMLFECCFGVPPEEEQARGRGLVVRLGIEKEGCEQ